MFCSPYDRYLNNIRWPRNHLLVTSPVFTRPFAPGLSKLCKKHHYIQPACKTDGMHIPTIEPDFSLVGEIDVCCTRSRINESYMVMILF